MSIAEVDAEGTQVGAVLGRGLGRGEGVRLCWMCEAVLEVDMFGLLVGTEVGCWLR